MKLATSPFKNVEDSHHRFPVYHLGLNAWGLLGIINILKGQLQNNVRNGQFVIDE